MIQGQSCEGASAQRHIKRGTPPHPITQGRDTAKERSGSGHGKGNDAQSLTFIEKRSSYKNVLQLQSASKGEETMYTNHISDDSHTATTSANMSGFLVM